MSSTLWLTAVQTLASAVAALPGYRAYQSTSSAPCTVYIGAELDDEERLDAVAEYLVVGYAGDPLRSTPSGSFKQTRGPMSSAHERNESGMIRLRIGVQPGDGTIIAAALTAEQHLQDVEALLTTSPTLGLAAPTTRRFLAELDAAGAYTLRQTSGGPQVTIDASVSYTARI
jgi:hypothetical protein